MVIASTFFWGSNFNAAHVLAAEVNPLTAATERFLLAMAIFGIMRLWVGKAEATLHWRDAFVLIPMGIIGVFGFNYAFFTALHTTSALNAALIMALSPMISTLLSTWLLKTKITAVQLLGIAIAFVGVSFVITGLNFQQLHIAVGDLWMLAACLVWSIYSVGSKKFASHIPPMQFSRWTVSIGAIMLTMTALVVDTPFTNISHLSLQSHGLLLYMSLFGSVLAYVFWITGVRALGANITAGAFNFVPVFTLLINIVLGTSPTAIQLFGMLLVLIGVAIAGNWLFRAKKITTNPKVNATRTSEG